MRYYRLRIGTALNKFEIQSTSTFKTNATPLNINFTIQSITDLNSQVASVVRLYNVPSGFYQALRSFVGSPIILEAGFSNSVFARKLNYSNVINRTLLCAKVESVSGNFTSHDNYVVFSTLLGVASVGDVLNSFNAKTQVKRFVLQIKPNEFIYTAIGRSLKQLLNTDAEIAFSQSVASQRKRGQTLIIGYTSLPELLAILEAELRLGFAFDASLNKAYIYERDNKADFAGLNEQRRGLINIGYGELLAQPQLINASGELTAITTLRPDIKLGAIVNLQGFIPTISNFQNINTFVSFGVASNTKIYYNGLYQVANIIHNGDFYGDDPMAWSSQMRLIPADVSAMSKNLNAKAVK